MSDFEIIENTFEAKNEFGFCYGAETFTITKDDIRALLEGKMLATTINCDEYSIFIKLETDKTSVKVSPGYMKGKDERCPGDFTLESAYYDGAYRK